MFMIECNRCHKKAFTMDGASPDGELDCDCCRTDHDHGKSANESGIVCRPVTIHVLPGSASLKVMP